MSKKSKVFHSHAQWSKGEKSTDSHGSFESAEAVCLRLLWDYGNLPRENIGYCQRVWITDCEGYVQMEKSREDKFIPSYAPQNRGVIK